MNAVVMVIDQVVGRPMTPAEYKFLEFLVAGFVGLVIAYLLVEAIGLVFRRLRAPHERVAQSAVIEVFKANLGGALSATEVNTRIGRADATPSLLKRMVRAKLLTQYGVGKTKYYRLTLKGWGQ